MTAKTDATCTGPGPDGTVCGRRAKYKERQPKQGQETLL